MANTQFTSNSVDLVSPTDFLRIVSPTIGYPSIQSPGSDIVIEINCEPGLPVEIANCAIEICKGHRKITLKNDSTEDRGSNYYWMMTLPIAKVTECECFLFRIIARIPHKVHEGLYDLRVTIAQKTLIQENSIQILNIYQYPVIR